MDYKNQKGNMLLICGVIFFAFVSFIPAYSLMFGLLGGLFSLLGVKILVKD